MILRVLWSQSLDQNFVEFEVLNGAILGVVHFFKHQVDGLLCDESLLAEDARQFVSINRLLTVVKELGVSDHAVIEECVLLGVNAPHQELCELHLCLVVLVLAVPVHVEVLYNILEIFLSEYFIFVCWLNDFIVSFHQLRVVDFAVS